MCPWARRCCSWPDWGQPDRGNETPPGNQVAWNGYFRLSAGAQTLERSIRQGDLSVQKQLLLSKKNGQEAGRGVGSACNRSSRSLVAAMFKAAFAMNDLARTARSSRGLPAHLFSAGRKRLRRGELEYSRQLAVAVGKRSGKFRQGGNNSLKPASDIGYGVGNGHGGIVFRVFCRSQTPSCHGEIHRPGKNAKKIPLKGNGFTPDHDFASGSRVKIK